MVTAYVCRAARRSIVAERVLRQDGSASDDRKHKSAHAHLRLGHALVDVSSCFVDAPGFYAGMRHRGCSIPPSGTGNASASKKEGTAPDSPWDHETRTKLVAGGPAERFGLVPATPEEVSGAIEALTRGVEERMDGSMRRR